METANFENLIVDNVWSNNWQEDVAIIHFRVSENGSVHNYAFRLDDPYGGELWGIFKEKLEGGGISVKPLSEMPEPEPEPEPIPDVISRRQFFQQLAAQEVISKQEALAAISNGAIPAAIETVIDQIGDEDEKFNAQMLLIGAQTFERLHPLSDTVKDIAGWTDIQRDRFWQEASKL